MNKDAIEADVSDVLYRYADHNNVLVDINGDNFVVDSHNKNFRQLVNSYSVDIYNGEHLTGKIDNKAGVCYRPSQTYQQMKTN